MGERNVHGGKKEKEKEKAMEFRQTRGRGIVTENGKKVYLPSGNLPINDLGRPNLS